MIIPIRSSKKYLFERFRIFKSYYSQLKNEINSQVTPNRLSRLGVE